MWIGIRDDFGGRRYYYAKSEKLLSLGNYPDGLGSQPKGAARSALFGFVKANQATHAVGIMCRVSKISRSGFHAWRDRPMSTRARMDLWLTGKTEAIHRGSRESFFATLERELLSRRRFRCKGVGTTH
jgi:hypothetical protein